MKNATNALLDALRARYGLTSDYQVGKMLGATSARIGNYRTGRTGMDEDLALKVAALLDRPAGAVLAELAAERSKSKDAAKVWKETARRLAQTAAVASMALGMCLLLGDPVSRAYAASGAPAGAASAALHNHARAASVLHIMRSVRAWLGRALAALKTRRGRP